MKKSAALILAFCLVIFCACSSSASKTDSAGYASQDAFLKDMAAGITQRLGNDKDSSKMNAEEESALYLKLVGYELDRIEKYQDSVFEDEDFNKLAHMYIEACQFQRYAAQNHKNAELYDSLWNGGRKTRAGIIIELYTRYGLPITSEQAASYKPSTTYTVSVSADSSTDSAKETTPYALGTKVTKSCERGEAVLSLDKVDIYGTCIYFTATNHGDIGFSSSSGSTYLLATFYDLDGYELGSRLTYLPEPWKPGMTIQFEKLDYSYVENADKVKYVLVEYFHFSGSGSGSSWTNVYFNYAFDLSGKQISTDKLIH